MATRWEPPPQPQQPKTEQLPKASVSTFPDPKAPTPTKKASVPALEPTAPPAKHTPFECKHCYEKTFDKDVRELIYSGPQTSADDLKVSQRFVLSPKFEILHGLFLKRSYGSRDDRAYEVMARYQGKKFQAWTNVSTAGSLDIHQEQQLSRRISVANDFGMSINPTFSTWCKAYLQYKTKTFCTRVGVAAMDFEPTMYTVSHLHGVHDRIAVGGKASMKADDHKKAYAGSVQFDTGAGIVSVTASTNPRQKFSASCTRHIAHHTTPHENNVAVVASVVVDPADAAKTRAAVGAKLRFPNSNSVVKARVDSRLRVNCNIESDIELLNVRSSFSSALDFTTHTYKFGIGFVLGGDLERPVPDHNPLRGAFL